MFIKYQLLNDGEVIAFNNYYEASKEADNKCLVLSEYGAIFGTDIAYACWNESGNKNDDEVIITYYKFDGRGNPIPLTEEEFKTRVC